MQIASDYANFSDGFASTKGTNANMRTNFPAEAMRWPEFSDCGKRLASMKPLVG
jgi:hypothetical protein